MMGLLSGLLALFAFCVVFIFCMFPLFIGCLDDAGLLKRFQSGPKLDVLGVWEQTKVSLERSLQQFLSKGDLEASAKAMELLERHRFTMPAIPFWKKLK